MLDLNVYNLMSAKDINYEVHKCFLNSTPTFYIFENIFSDENNSTWHAYTFNNTHVMRDENHPLLSLKRTDPHSMELIIRPQNPKTITMIRFIQAFSFCFGQLVQKFCPSFALCIIAKLSDYLIISHCRRTFWIFILFSSKIFFFQITI